MADIKRNIRFYQPNDPYYWEVDNLPLTDLLTNDTILEDRISRIEETLSDPGGAVGAGGSGGTGGNGGSTGTGSGALSGVFGLGAIEDLKGYTEPFDGHAGRFGKIFVRPGKFTARVQMPATRENGARMMRDHCTYFNNEDINGEGGLDSNSTQLDFVRESRGLGRTAVVEFLGHIDGSDKAVVIPPFDDADFNSADPPVERLDLVYIKGSKPLDCDGDSPTTPSTYLQGSIPKASLGVIKGAYFRTDAGAGEHANGARFTDGVGRLRGRTTGMSNSEIPVETCLDNFGTVPMPDDLVNFAWHRNYDTNTQELSISALTNKQIEYESAFSLPVAYVRVPRGYREGDPITPQNVVDVRPFFRTAELDYNERAAIAASVSPNGHNFFITKFHLVNKWINPLDARLTTVENSLAGILTTLELHGGMIYDNQVAISGLNWAVSGTGTEALEVLGPHELRIRNLEASSGSTDGDAGHTHEHDDPGDTGGGGGPLGITITTEHFVMVDPYQIFNSQYSHAAIGSAGNPQIHTITNAIPAAHRDKLVTVYFRAHYEQNGGETTTKLLYIAGGNSAYREICSGGGMTPESGEGYVDETAQTNSFVNTVTKVTDSEGAVILQISTYVNSASSRGRFNLHVDGYTWKDTVSF